MSQPHSTPFSEVLRHAESTISRANDVRRRAEEMMEQATRLHEEAYSSCVEALGEEEGRLGYRMSCRSVGVEPDPRVGGVGSVNNPPAPVRVEPTAPVYVPPAPVVHPPAVIAPQPVQAHQTAVATPVVGSPAPQPVQVPAPSPAAASTQDDPSRVERFGVSFKRSKLAEAEDVIEQARRTAARNQKSNPYADDRGRNAWRNNLFVAALAAERSGDTGAEAADDVHVPEDDVDPSTSTEVEHSVSSLEEIADRIANNPAIMAVLESLGEETVSEDEGDIIADMDVFSEDPVSTADDVVVTEEVKDEVSTPPAVPVPDAATPRPPARSVPFTRNPAQTPSAREAAPVASPPQPPFARTARRDDETELHVPKPVQNRTVAHGQAVPAPPGLSEHLRSLQTSQQEKQSSPVTTAKPPVGRPGPAFLRK